MNTCHRRRVFSLSLGDWLDPKIPIEWLADALGVMWQCQDLDFLLVSKRLEQWEKRMLQLCNQVFVRREVFDWLEAWTDGKAPENLWILGSAENQAMLEKRSRELARIPAVVRGLSCEPLLEQLDFNGCHCTLDWVIFGGESGKDARMCNIDWIREGLRQVKERAVPCFVKQLGSDARGNYDGFNQDDQKVRLINVPFTFEHRAGADPAEWPEDLRVQEWPPSPARGILPTPRP